MRSVPTLFLALLLLAGCKREAQEAVAEAKGAAAEAQRAAKEAANQAAATAKSAADQARSATDDAAAKAHAAAEQARAAAANATDSAKQGLDSTGQTIREMTAGDQLLGVVVGVGSNSLSLRPESGPVQTLRTDGRTKWILHGAAAGKEGFPAGTTVRVTYIVQDGRHIASRVEALTR